MNRITTRRWVSCTLAITMTLFALALPKPAQAEVITNERIPVAIGVFIPCANGGAGEGVILTGELHVLITATADSNGGSHFKFHFQPQGISGEGLVTGDKYQATGVTQEHTNVNSSLVFNDTFINNFRIIGQGPGNNLLVHTTFHVTVNANGDVTADVLNASADCK